MTGLRRGGRPRPLLLLSVLVLAAMAGCTDAPATPDLADPWTGAPDLVWGILDANTTAAEPWELQGHLFVAWTETTFAIHAEQEDDLPVYLVRTERTVYTSDRGMGWIATPIEVAVDEARYSNRLLLWDLRTLLADPRMEVEQTTERGERIFRASGTLGHGGRPLVVEARVATLEGRIVEATVASPAGRESPYLFLPPAGDIKLPDFPQTPPPSERTLDQATVDTKDPVAQAAHARIIRLVNAYARNHGGVLPEQVDAETLRAEMLVEGGGPWPTSAYDGQPVKAQAASGHFSWQRCGLSNGRYIGHGWDGLVVEQAYGAGCPAP